MKTLWMITACAWIGGLSACQTPTPRPQAPASGGGVYVPSATEAVRGEDARFVRLQQELQSKDPAQEAQAAIDRGERYFLCNAGRSATVPGLAANVYASVRDRCETRCLEGVTDALYGPNHRSYLGVALDYSARWNQTMLPACR